MRDNNNNGSWGCSWEKEDLLLLQNTEFDSQYIHGRLQPSIPPVLEDLVLSSDLPGTRHTCAVYTYLCMYVLYVYIGKMLIHINEKIKAINYGMVTRKSAVTSPWHWSKNAVQGTHISWMQIRIWVQMFRALDHVLLNLMLFCLSCFSCRISIVISSLLDWLEE